MILLEWKMIIKGLDLSNIRHCESLCHCERSEAISDCHVVSLLAETCFVIASLFVIASEAKQSLFVIASEAKQSIFVIASEAKQSIQLSKGLD